MSRRLVLPATVLAVVGVLVAVALLGRPPASAEGLPQAPDGSRWVGMDGVVVAVPDWWSVGETQCLAPVEDTVYFDQAAQADCADPADPATVREVSALAVFDGTCCYGEMMSRSMSDVGDVVERPGCEEWFEGVCRRFFALPDTDVVFAVTIAEEGDGDYEQIRDSARVLPDGLTTVPLRGRFDWTPSWGADPSAVPDLVAAIERAGLVADVLELDASEAGLESGSLLEVTPSLGSVVEVGATVTVTVAR